MASVDHDGMPLIDKPKPDMEILVTLTIDGQDIARNYRAADITEIDWHIEMESMADTIANANDMI